MQNFSTRIAAACAVLCALCSQFNASSATFPLTNTAPRFDKFLFPTNLTGKIYADSSTNKLLFTFRRTASLSNSTVHVLREFNTPNGTLVARERVVYESNQFVSYELEEPLSRTKGRATLTRSANNSRESIRFEYSEGPKRQSDTESWQNDTLVNDMVGPFIQDNWNTLIKGLPVKFRFIAIGRTETVGFRFIKESESTSNGIPVLIIKMEPTSFVIARFLKPLTFTVEKEGKHRVLQYQGRTTPRNKKGTEWEDLDALTVFDWD